MNILFLTLNPFETIEEHTIYSDMLSEFARNGHSIYAVSPIEKKHGINTHISNEKNIVILRVRIGNMHNVNLIRKGITTVTIGSIYKNAIDKYFGSERFDLILYSTPPITLASAVEYVKRRDSAKTYLLLKDIFPQNAIDIGMMSKNGLKGLLYKHFRRQEKKLYRISDWIGCMSQANADYVVKHNPEVDPRIVEVCPNSIEVIDKSVDEETRKAIRNKYGIPLDEKVFIYGGNLGKPQGIPFLIECLRKCKDVVDAYFLIVGDGTEYHLIEELVDTEKPMNVKLMKRLPKEDYDTVVGACDVGLIFLDHRFTIPNFPSRLLGYMQAKLPVLACTDPNTDIGKVIVNGGFGWWCESNSVEGFCRIIEQAMHSDTEVLGEKAYRYLQDYYTVQIGYNIIQKRVRQL